MLPLYRPNFAMVPRNTSKVEQVHLR